jgi:hypothetical protein
VPDEAAKCGAYSLGLFGTETTLILRPQNGEVLFNGIDANENTGLRATNWTAGGTYEFRGMSGAYSGGYLLALPIRAPIRIDRITSSNAPPGSCLSNPAKPPAVSTKPMSC